MKKLLFLITVLLVSTFSLVNAPKANATFELPKVTMCYNQVTIQVSVTSVLAYLAQGATLGACVEVEPTPTPTPTPEVTPTPTPEVTPTPTPDPCNPQDLELKILLDEVQEPCPTPTPEPTPELSQPENNAKASDAKAPVCSDGNTNGAVANPHVYRNGSSATVNFFVTDGDKAHVFYKEVDAQNWQYAVANVGVNADKFGQVTINNLDPNKGYTFGIMQVQGCGGGNITAVVVDGPEPTLFNLSYWLFN